ncbi:hypothetical protein AB8955_06590 [Yersinia enterocolitica]|uniref:hypothetical protein n=1 Tax=Yersinia enterocolitica TaxID=630 RepID=UPI003D0713E9
MAVSSYNYQRSPTFLNKKTTSNHAQGERKVLLMALLAHYQWHSVNAIDNTINNFFIDYM